jgi:erythronate-4-phosphate dehydrogenase
MIRIIADDKIPFLKGVFEPYAKVTYLPGKQITREASMEADALLIRTRTKCNSSLLNGTPVKFIATATIGFDHINTEYCDSHNIMWTNAPGCNSYSVQQYIAAALLRIAGESGFNLKDKTLGIIGVGDVGSKIEKLAKTIGTNVILNDPPRARKESKAKFDDLEKLLKLSDIITLHVPLNLEGEDKTFHLFGDDNLKKIKKGGWLINSSRGEVVETEALKNALSSKKLAGAVLDVWENEPDIDAQLMEMTFLATPHIAGYSTDGKANGTSMSVAALCEYFNLPLQNWYPENIPLPGNPFISIECKGKTAEEIIREAVIQTYEIIEDDIKLRFSPAGFEKQRGDYPVRREFPAFTIRLKGGTGEIQKMLVELGFKIEMLKG